MSVIGHIRPPAPLNTLPARYQFLNLNGGRSLLGKQSWNRRIVFKAVDLFLFGSPNEQAVRLKRVWANDINTKPRWKIFINRLKDELGWYTVFVSLVRFVCRISYCSQSTVMLAVNFSFLAVPGVVTPGSAASPVEIIIYCSVVSTVASMVFAFGLMNRYSDPELITHYRTVCLHDRDHNHLKCSRWP